MHSITSLLSFVRSSSPARNLGEIWRIGMRAGPFSRGYWAPDDGSRETQIQGLDEGSKKPNCLLVGCLISYMHVHFQRNVASIPYVARFT